MIKYQNGNAEISITSDGTRTITFEDTLKLEYPLNIDIRVTTACSLGKNPITGKSVCEFCHESAVTNGRECNYDELKSKLAGLPAGIELAIGGNKLTNGLKDFLQWARDQQYICNLTVNSLHLKAYRKELIALIDDGSIKGLGISYRKGFSIEPDDYFIKYNNTILHVIAGIDNVDEIVATPFNKVLVLGYKTFGYGKDYYSETVKDNLTQWKYRIPLLFNKQVCSFDNLALEQLDVKRLMPAETWATFNQGEHSFYIDAANEVFAPSSRSPNRTNWNTYNVKEFFKRTQN